MLDGKIDNDAWLAFASAVTAPQLVRHWKQFLYYRAPQRDGDLKIQVCEINVG